ncbi:MAG: hypothetical protein Tsb002_15610 [Wenzhouxiangellaceae bacterium]
MGDLFAQLKPRARSRTLVVDEQLLVGQPLSDDCGQVVVSELNPRGSGTAHEVQVLSRVDAGLACAAQDRFGTAMAQTGDWLVIGAPGYLLTWGNVDTTVEAGGELFIYRRQPATFNEPASWRFEQRLDGADSGLKLLGHHLAAQGKRLLAGWYDIQLLDDGLHPPYPSLEMKGAVILTLQDDRWHISSQANALRAFNRVTDLFISGEQIIVSYGPVGFGLSHTEVLQESNDFSGDWRSVQRLPSTTIPLSANPFENYVPVAVDGDRMMMRPSRLFRTAREDNFALIFYRRDRAGRWLFDQSLDLIETAREVGPLNESFLPVPGEQARTDYALRGADLLVAWALRGERHQLIHYRLNADSRFSAVQALPPMAGVAGHLALGDRIWAATLGAVPDRLITSTRRTGSNHTVDRGHSGGWWFGPQRNGQGLGIEVLPNNRMQIVWVSHDNQGRQLWLHGAGNIDVDRVTVDLIRPLGGQFGNEFDPATVQRLPFGAAELWFNSCDTGELRYDIPAFGSGTLPLLRLTSVDGLDCGEATASRLAQRWTGSWFDPAHNGEGLMMHVTPTLQGPRLSSLWMTYNADGEQAYLYGSAPLDGSGLADFTRVIQPLDLRFSSAIDEAATIVPWGEYQLESTGCDQAGLRYAGLNSDFGSGMQQLERFAIPLGTVCE